MKNWIYPRPALPVIALLFLLGELMAAQTNAPPERYPWTTDHIQIGVRWQPFVARNEINAYDATRPVIAEDSSYAQFWVSWKAAESAAANTNYATNMSTYLADIERAVDVCVAEGLQVEFVFWHCPEWASESGHGGGVKSKPNHYRDFVTRIARHFKGRVGAYQLQHEANLKGFIRDGDIDFLLNEIFVKGARAIRTVYAEEPAHQVIISTSGCSPCEGCDTMKGLGVKGGEAVSLFYELQAGHSELMSLVDAINMNMSDNFNGYGSMDGSYIGSSWDNYDLAKGKLNAAGHLGKQVMGAESWIVWDNAGMATDVNGDGVKDERDAYSKAITIIGKCLERGLTTANLPWSDNSSSWAMGLTKRRDVTGVVAKSQPDWVTPAHDGGPPIVTRKMALRGFGETTRAEEGSGHKYTVENYINPSDPNHLHYYIWRWYAQLAGGADEVIRHAMAGEIGNDVIAHGPGFTGNERYRLAGYNRTKQEFTVLAYASGAGGIGWSEVKIPARIKEGMVFNTAHSLIDFRDEGFADGDQYIATVETKRINGETGADENVKVRVSPPMAVADGMLIARVVQQQPFTKVTFRRVDEVQGK